MQCRIQRGRRAPGRRERCLASSRLGGKPASNGGQAVCRGGSSQLLQGISRVLGHAQGHQGDHAQRRRQHSLQQREGSLASQSAPAAPAGIGASWAAALLPLQARPSIPLPALSHQALDASQALARRAVTGGAAGVCGCERSGMGKCLLLLLPLLITSFKPPHTAPHLHSCLGSTAKMFLQVVRVGRGGGQSGRAAGSRRRQAGWRAPAGGTHPRSELSTM